MISRIVGVFLRFVEGNKSALVGFPLVSLHPYVVSAGMSRDEVVRAHQFGRGNDSSPIRGSGLQGIRQGRVRSTVDRVEREFRTFVKPIGSSFVDWCRS